MSRFNLALAALLAPVAFAIPQSPAYGGYGHGHAHHSHGPHRPSGSPSGGPSASGTGLSPIGASSAPYGLGNSTGVAGPTGTGTAPGIHSTVTVIPQPVSSPAAGGVSGVGNSPTGLSSAGGECGLATVTVTSANTVTVTVPAAPVSSPQESSPISASSVPSAPFPAGNTTVVGSTGTIGAGIPTAPGIPILSGLPSSSPVAESNTANSPIGGTSAPVAGSSSVAAHTYNHVSMPSYHHSAPAPVSSAPAAPVVESTPASSATSIPSGAFYSQPSASSAAAVPATSASSPTYTAPSSTPTPSSTSASSAAAIPATSASSSAHTAPSSTPSPSSTSSPSTSGGDVVPRGLVYNTAALTSLFNGPKIGWCYNWDSAPGGDIPSSMNFVPMLWSTNDFHLPNWKTAASSAISKGATHILGFNEPDLGAQANMSPQEAADAWNNLEQFGDKVKIGSPSVCNGPAPQGLTWLSDFMGKCSNCQVDFLAIHWYGLASDDGVADLKAHIGKAQAVAKGKPIWLTEFQPSGSTEDQASFMGKMLPWLDDKSNGVERYAYYQVDGILASGNAKTSLGNDYTS